MVLSLELKHCLFGVFQKCLAGNILVTVLQDARSGSVLAFKLLWSVLRELATSASSNCLLWERWAFVHIHFWFLCHIIV